MPGDGPCSAGMEGLIALGQPKEHARYMNGPPSSHQPENNLQRKLSEGRPLIQLMAQGIRVILGPKHKCTFSC